MSHSRKFVVVQTAFPGDVVLTLPLVQQLREMFPDAFTGFVAIPGTADLLDNHPAVSERIVFDKRGADRGIGGIFRFAKSLRVRNFDVAIVPHRSLRSALVVFLAGIPRRIGFTRSAGRVLLTDVVDYDESAHEIDRNLSLLGPLGGGGNRQCMPSLYPDYAAVDKVDQFLRAWRAGGGSGEPLIAIAPGSVWATKRWPAEKYAGLGKLLLRAGYGVVLIGSSDDRALCAGLMNSIGSPDVLNGAGEFSLLESAELIRRCRLIVSNDSAPVHLAGAMRVPVVAIYGATVPRFGFAPRGKQDAIVEREGLACRPCGIHGGQRCPIGTFECMLSITPDMVRDAIRRTLRHSATR
jgi:heptosyltransferase II